MDISKRLITICETVPMSACVADIGTDHAYIPIYLVKHHKAKTAIAMDVRSGPLEIAKSNVINYGLEEKIQLRLSDGLEKLEKGEADTIVVAGMGGSLICKILEEGNHILEQVTNLILQPQSDIDRVRKQIHKLAYTITEENMLMEDGKYYTIIRAVKGIECYEHDYEYRYGKKLIEKKDAILKEALEKRYRTLEALTGHLNQEMTEKVYLRKKEIEIEMNALGEVIRCL